jgi:hypothetical protein
MGDRRMSPKEEVKDEKKGKRKLMDKRNTFWLFL